MKSINYLSQIACRAGWGSTMLVALALVLGACSDKKDSTNAESASADSIALAGIASSELSPMKPDSSLGWVSASAAGMSWEIPSDWSVGPEMPMRAGTYFAAVAEGDTEPAECRVNFFGTGQGGEIDDNILRWAGQMEVEGEEGKAPTPIVSRTEVAGIPVVVIELSGVYLSRSRPMADDLTRKSGSKMFAAIATASEGTVFFKMTGTLKTMEANRESFRQMIGSITAGS